jgi:hypothetical protein
MQYCTDGIVAYVELWWWCCSGVLSVILLRQNDGGFAEAVITILAF